MNKLILIFTLVAFATVSFAQTELFRAKLKKKEVPMVVITAIDEDFPEADIMEYAAIPITIIEDEIYVYSNEEAMEGDYETYVITLKSKSGTIRAAYDKSGNLISTVERMKDVPLPRVITRSIGRHFPGWGIVGDRVVMTSLKNGKQKTQYRVKLQKGKETHRVMFDANGNIIRGASKAKKHRQIVFP